MNADIVIRRAEQGDLPALTEIYNYYVRETPVTFDLEPKSLVQRQEWLDGFAPAGRSPDGRDRGERAFATRVRRRTASRA